MTNYFLPLLKQIGFIERRKNGFQLLRAALRMKLPLYTLALSFGFGALALTVGYIYYEQLYAMIIEYTSPEDFLRTAVTQHAGGFIEASVLLMTGYFLLMTAITTVYIHRIAGPAVAMSRHIRALKNGLYSHRIKLRRQDELKDLAKELNELAETLETYEKRETGGR
jgi:HAMP domain-containing protein